MHALNMVICHSSEPVKSWKLSARKRRLVTRLSDSHENRSPTAQLAQRPTEKPGAILTRVRVPGGARDLSPSHLSIQTLLRYSHSPRVQWHVSTSVSTLKPPKHWQPYSSVWTPQYCTHWQPYSSVWTPQYCTHWQPYSSVWTPQYCTHWQQWVALLLRLPCLLCLTQVRRPELPTRDDEVTHTLTNNSPRKAATEIVVFLWICQFDI